MVTSWLNRPSDALIMLQKDTFKFAISAILESSFGSPKFEDEQLVEELHESYNVVSISYIIGAVFDGYIHSIDLEIRN